MPAVVARRPLEVLELEDVFTVLEEDAVLPIDYKQNSAEGDMELTDLTRVIPP